MTSILCCSLSQADGQAFEDFYHRASPARRKKADALHHQKDKLRCLLGEVLLRRCLGTANFTLLQGEFGKPYVKERKDFHFNISHSGDFVVLAWGDKPVGIDIEQIRGDAKIEKLARRHFTQPEQDYVFRGEEAEKSHRFFQIWTAKESYLKYLGTGLSKSLQSFDVRSMDFPHFFTQTLGDCCLTLCTEDGEFQLELLEFSQL